MSFCRYRVLQRHEGKIISSALQATFTNHLSGLIAAITQRNASTVTLAAALTLTKHFPPGLICVYDTLPAAV